MSQLNIYKASSALLAIVFAAVGLLFLAIPDRVLEFFNTLSSAFGMAAAPMVEWNFYVILAAGYMYLVTLLAFLMFKNPGDFRYPQLLVHAKWASAILSLAFFLIHAHYLIYLVNFVVDGLIGLVVIFLIKKSRSRIWAFS